VAAIGRQPVEQEQFRQRGARLLLDFAVELDEGHAAPGGQPRAQGRLAGAAQTDQRDPVFALLRSRTERAVQRVRGAADFGRGKPRQPLRKQRDFSRCLRGAARQLLDRHIDRLRDLLQQQDRHVAAAGFQRCKIAFGHPRIARQNAPRHPPARADFANALADRGEIGGVGVTVGNR